MNACVLGAGAFGTAVSSVLASNCEQVRLWSRDGFVVEAVNVRHENPDYLPGVQLPKNVCATSSLLEAAQGAAVVVVAVPSHAAREVMAHAAPHLPRQVPVVTVAKGIENDTLLTMTEVLEDCLPEELHPYLAVLSGPSFAKEMVQRLPTVVTIASHWDKVALRCQQLFHTESFRTYTSRDVMGVQLGGALKNVVAIAAGIADGLGFGHNARAGIITRGLAEMTRLAVRRGANPLTLSGLAGLGDLVLTCTAELSRNRRLGLELGRGKPLSELLGETHQLVEGVRTAASAHDLAQKLGVELPICEQVYRITHQGKDPRDAVVELMRRQPKGELM